MAMAAGPRSIGTTTHDRWMRPLTVLAISGSLRKASLNTAMLTMAAACAPPVMQVKLCDVLGALPLFNPDLETNEPAAVARLRRDIAAADAVLAASPEYAHGVSGVMKNALDWMVASGVFVDKPVVLWNASPRASHALAALRETLTVMAARWIADADLELLIKGTDDGAPSVNPDPGSMHRSLKHLAQVLRAS